MRRRPAIALAVALLALLARVPGRSAADKISSDLLKAMASAAGSDAPLRVWVYFADKGVAGQGALRTALAEARDGLGAHTLWRRAKVRPDGDLVDAGDLPVRADYQEQVRARLARGSSFMAS